MRERSSEDEGESWWHHLKQSVRRTKYATGLQGIFGARIRAADQGDIGGVEGPNQRSRSVSMANLPGPKSKIMIEAIRKV
jgi:hypothetical protein